MSDVDDRPLTRTEQALVRALAAAIVPRVRAALNAAVSDFPEKENCPVRVATATGLVSRAPHATMTDVHRATDERNNPNSR